MTAGAVSTVCTTSTRRMTGAGLKKCMPMTRSGRPLDAAIWVTGSEEVLVASTVDAGQIPSRSANSAALTSSRSGTASITRSAAASASRSVVKPTRPR